MQAVGDLQPQIAAIYRYLRLTAERGSLSIDCAPRLLISVASQESPLRKREQGASTRMTASYQVPCEKPAGQVENQQPSCAIVVEGYLYTFREAQQWQIDVSQPDLYLLAGLIVTALDQANRWELTDAERQRLVTEASELWLCEFKQKCSVKALKASKQ